MKTRNLILIGALIAFLVISVGNNVFQYQAANNVTETIKNLQARNDNQKKTINNATIFLKSIGYKALWSDILEGDYNTAAVPPTASTESSANSTAKSTTLVTTPQTTTDSETTPINDGPTGNPSFLFGSYELAYAYLVEQKDIDTSTLADRGNQEKRAEPDHRSSWNIILGSTSGTGRPVASYTVYSDGEIIEVNP